MKLKKHKDGHCDYCGARLVCAHCFSCNNVNQYVLEKLIKYEYEMAKECLASAAKRYVEAEKELESNGWKVSR